MIPPAWKKVWISPHPNGHIQAVGTDAAGRRQYLYHAQWQEERAEEKFDRVLELSRQLPAWRADIADDLKSTGLSGIGFLPWRCTCLTVVTSVLAGSSTRRRTILTASQRCSATMSRCGRTQWRSTTRRRVGCAGPWWSSIPMSCAQRDHCFVVMIGRSGSGVPHRVRWVDVHADDLNARFKELVGDEYSVKDLRTWHGTVLAAAAFVDADPPVSKRVIKGWSRR